jgi:PIN domain nuclease of toxin-antitoxin system
MLGDSQLSARERTVLDDLPSGQQPRLCDTRLREVGMLVQLGRLQLDDTPEDWLRIAASPATVEVIPVTPAVVAEMNRLPRVSAQRR